MKGIFFLLLLVPIYSFAQLGDNNFYFGAKFGYSFGMSQSSYLVSDASDLYGDTISTYYTPGDAWIPELTLGIKMTENFYVEASYAYFANKFFLDNGTEADPYPQAYTFNRSAFLINALYFVPVKNAFSIYVGGGAAYYMPSKLEVQVLHIKEELNYSGSFGLQGELGAAYRVGVVAFRTGLRYRWETYQFKGEQSISEQRLQDNPELSELKASGIDITLGVAINF